ncbi:hypothetical protein PGH26_03720 [Sporosarcina jeotgali]|uniref:DUF4203 domain-containing protein n=1 Tax=Sporosarcina jeotgali TaxID=3020056 RepID=A0ABZ0L0C3_9BACL|nr:hypothetical protein [Sporosarcina sp. B2O-1]WOV85047.1 hypothetical protein PGH26_03720 [Sporosarcina sp. B2O-1]
MPVTDYFLLWKVTVPSSWIAAVIGFILAWLAVKMKFGKPVADLFIDALFTTIIVWKLSVIVTDFETVRRAPLAILYFNGGTFGFLAGLVVAAVVILLSRKPKPPMMSQGLLLGIVTAQAGYQVMMALLNESAFLIEGITIVVFGMLAVLSFVHAQNERIPIVYGAGLFVAAHAFIGALQPVGFTGIPFTATVLACILAVLVTWRFTQRKETDGGIQ